MMPLADDQKVLGAELFFLQTERNQLWWFGHLRIASRYVQLERDPEANLEHNEGITYPMSPWISSESSRRSWRVRRISVLFLYVL